MNEESKKNIFALIAAKKNNETTLEEEFYDKTNHHEFKSYFETGRRGHQNEIVSSPRIELAIKTHQDTQWEKNQIDTQNIENMPSLLDIPDSMQENKPLNLGIGESQMPSTSGSMVMTQCQPSVPPSMQQWVQLTPHFWWDPRNMVVVHTFNPGDNKPMKQVCNFKLTIFSVSVIKSNLNEQGTRVYDISIVNPYFGVNKRLSIKEFKSKLVKIGEMIDPAFNILNKGLYEQYLAETVQAYIQGGGGLYTEVDVQGWVLDGSQHMRYCLDGSNILVGTAQGIVKNGIKASPSKEAVNAFINHYLNLSTDPGILMTGLLYTMLAHVAVPYKKVTGQRLQTAMVFQGETQFGKTTLAKLLVRMLQPHWEMNNFFKYDTTNAAISHVLAKYGQGLYVWDDVYRKVRSDDGKKDAEKMNTIARILGDGYVPGKMRRFGNGLENSTPFDGGAIITAEFMPAEGESTVGRVIVNKFDHGARINFEDTRDLNLLQTNMTLGDSFMAQWVLYMENIFNTQGTDIAARHNQLFNALKKQGLHTRLCSYGASILNIWYYAYTFIEKHGERLAFNIIKQYLLRGIEQQQLEYLASTDVGRLCEVIRNGIELGELSVAQSNDDFDVTSNAGFINDEGNYCLIIPLLERYLVEQGGYSMSWLKGLYEKMCSQGLQDTTNRKKNRISRGGHRPYYFVFSRHIMDDKMDEMSFTLDIKNNDFKINGGK